MSQEDSIIREVQLLQGAQRVGVRSEAGVLRDDETLIFYADSTEHVRAQVRRVVRELASSKPALDDQS